jgi:uncharacterized protein (DUF1501 family)
MPGHLRGPNPALAAGSLANVSVPVDGFTPLPLWQQAFTQLHAGERPEVSAPMKSALAAATTVGTIPASTATGYPAGSFGTALKDIARMVKGDLGLRFANVPYGGWDHHENFGAPTATGGTFAGRLSGLAQGLAAFAADLGPDLDRVTIVTLTEFGRRVKQNGSGGLDHGHGFSVLLLGGGVNGGKVHGTWPGLATAKLDQKLDLAVTTDYRAIVSEILVGRMGVPAGSAVFPGYTPTTVGAVRAG